MAPTIYEIDPNADTIIVLKNPCTNFAPWSSINDEPVVSETAHLYEYNEEPVVSEIAPTSGHDDFWAFNPSPPKKTSRKKKGKKRIVSVEAEPPQPPLTSLEDLPPEHASPEDASLLDPTLEDTIHDTFSPTEHETIQFVENVDAVATTSAATLFGDGTHGSMDDILVNKRTEMAVDDSTRGPDVPESSSQLEEDGIYYHVSSRHLMLASPWFKRALTKEGWNESSRDESDGRFHIPAQDWDAEAFLIVLRIFHLRNKQVPRTITIDMLAKIAVLVDYYECGEALELFTDMWIKHLRQSSLLSDYDRDLILWIWVSWVFELADRFQYSTAVAIKRSSEPIRTLGLPIPLSVSEELKSQRYQAIDSVIEGVHGLLETYRKATYICPISNEYSFQCGSFLFGALTKELHRLELLNPQPHISFLGSSLVGVCEQLHTIRSPPWYVYRAYSQHDCGLTEAVVSITSITEAAVKGLDVKSMKKGKGISN